MHFQSLYLSAVAVSAVSFGWGALDKPSASNLIWSDEPAVVVYPQEDKNSQGSFGKYRKPASVWEAEGYPIGNGRVGAMIFSAPGRERLALNEISLWSGGANPGGGYGYGPDAGTNQFGNYLPFGDLFVDFKKGDQPASLSVEDFTRALDLRDGIHKVNYKADGVTYDREAFSSTPANVLVLNYKASKPGQFSADFSVNSQLGADISAKGPVITWKGMLKNGIPMVTVNDSGGARLQEGVAALSGYAQVFYNNVLASGVVPQISMILGPCAGGAAYSPALTDFIIMRNSGNAGMYITGPKVIEQVTYEKCTMDDIGSAAIHATVSGNVHFVADSDAHAMDILKRLLSFLPSNNTEEPPHKLDTPLDLSADEGMSDLIPGDNRTPLDVQPIISRLVDNGDFLEVHKDFAKNVVVGFGRICGVVVGIIANQPNVKAGCLDIDSSDKAARFIRFCNAFNIPLVNLVDVPGFLPGKNQERGGIIRHGAKLIFAYSQATVPKVTLIMRKAYGGAYIAMCCKDLGADAVFAWPGAEIAVMGAEGAVPVLYGRELKAVEDPAEKAKRQGELLEEYREAFYNPYVAAGMGQITEVINPEETRAKIAFALRTLLNKKEVRPAKKHGNIPL